MMLQVDVESNQTLLAESLLEQTAVNENETLSDQRPRQSSFRNGYENSYVMAHFLAGMATLFLLAAVVFLNYYQSVVHDCEAGGDNSDFATDSSAMAANGVVGNLVGCNITNVVG